MNMAELRQSVLDVARRAGDVIMDIYGKDDFAVQTKDDDSPLTRADVASNRLITEALRELTPNIPILAEESAQAGYAERRDWTRLWLVDPLDGTKEFIKRNDEFTVNIALVENGQPVLGVVHVPALMTSYSASLAEGAFRHRGGDQVALRATPPGGTALRVVVSRSHAGDSTTRLLERLRGQYDVESVARGSALKICLVAEGEADFYPRLGPTMEWDTAAAHAVIDAAGGVLVALPERQPLRYNKENLRNPHFAVAATATAPFLDTLEDL
ncbi:MAG: 3'(2'),5'-bisphosphate nucleotidase CysQ [Proteobacteria bacterium]|nr:3'(2'),5'-bisphosphate nucleotidase CysQ [Pseudomonadota bacterium]